MAKHRRAALAARAARCILTAALVVALAPALSACDDERPLEKLTTTSSVAGGSSPGGGASVEKVVDLGRTEVVEPDPASVVASEECGLAPANHVLVMMEEGRGRSDAEQVAGRLGGTVVGEVEFMNLFQIVTSGVTAQDLETTLQTAASLEGVKAAYPNGADSLKDTLTVARLCSPLNDPLYQDANRRPYDMIGMQNAWAILRASEIELHDTHVGVVDSAVYARSGHGFEPELYFPDATGARPAGKVKTQGLAARDITGEPDPESGTGGLTHGTMVAHVIGADADNGATGVAAVLGDKLTITCGSFLSEESIEVEGVAVQVADETAGLPEEAQYNGFYVQSFVQIVRLVEAGATVINLSFGPTGDPHSKYAWRSAIYKDFLERMRVAHPDVLFVAAAGNENRGLTGQNFGPGGINVPNLITVGMLNHSGERATMVDMVGLEKTQTLYDDLKADGTVPPDMTFEEFVKRANIGSNYAKGAGEVTLSACGVDVPVGRDPDGQPVVADGTSITAPQVAAAAALLKAIDPTLTAEQIKEILVRTASTTVETDGVARSVPAEVGGRVLRVDQAVLDVINRVRGPGNELVYDELLELAAVFVAYGGDPSGYQVNAWVTRVGPLGTQLRISLDGPGEIVGTATVAVKAAGYVAQWTVIPGDEPVRVRVHRLDNGACSSMVLGGAPTGSTSSSTTVASNTPPVAEPLTTSTDPGVSVPVTLRGTDADGDSLTYKVVSGPANGTLTGTAPFLTYKPKAGFTGTDTFTYTVHDGRAASAATTVMIEVAGLRWVRKGAAAVNASKEPLELYGGGTTPGFFTEGRFEGMFLIYSVSETSFSVDNRWVDHGIEDYNVTLTCRFDAPPAVLLPGQSYSLEAHASHSGTLTAGNPGIAFQYRSSLGGAITPDAVLSYFPWSKDTDLQAAKTYLLKVPEGRPGDEFEISAFLWNTPPCLVVWTYVAE